MITEIKVQNPEASMPLTISLDIVCNTPEEKILANVLTNAKKIKDWIKSEPEHDYTAIICGSAPSLRDHIQEIRKAKNMLGAKIFALNGACSYLNSHGIIPDYQVIMDAQPETITLIGMAEEYLFASQVDPSLFDKVPNARLWHATYGNVAVDEQEGFPEHDDDYCLVGASATVGNTSLVLAYVMGYRQLEIYGMDSSHRDGKGHVQRQKMNDGDPCTIVHFGGKEYISSFTMKLQADFFIGRAKQLEAAGCKIALHGDGLLPAMWNAPPMPEIDKYKAMWAHDDYRTVSPGEDVVVVFLEVVKPTPTDTIIDFGCGTGRGGLAISEALNNYVLLVDFTENSRDEAARKLPFVQADLTQPLMVACDYGYCCDVMEHIQPEMVGYVITNIMSCCRNGAFFQISTVPDTMGALIGQDLHLTVQPHDWWLKMFETLGFQVQWSQEQSIAALFYVLKA